MKPPNRSVRIFLKAILVSVGWFLFQATFGVLAESIPQYSSRVWQTDDGLPQNSVQTITQTSDGYLWVGTKEGLARFDGIRFTVPESFKEFAGHSINALCEDRSGAFWIGIENGGLVRWKDGKFLRLTQADGLPSDSVKAVFQSKDGRLWIGTSAGLAQCKDEKIIRLPQRALSDRSIRSLCADAEGRIWVATGNGLFRLKDTEAEIFSSHNGLPTHSIRAVWQDRKGDVWIGSAGGLTRLHEGQFKLYSQADGLFDPSVSALYEDRAGNLWIGTYDGLNRMVNGELLAEKNNDGTSFDAIYCFYEDREGDLWVGSKGGLHRLNRRYFTTYTKEQGLSHNTAISVLEDRKGRMWIATWGGGLNVFENGKMRACTNQLTSNLLLSLCEDHNGDLWVGTDYDWGINRLKDGRVDQIYRKEAGFTDPAVKVIHEDRNGTIWIGTAAGLVRFKDDKFERVGRLTNRVVNVIHEDRFENLWVGTSVGLYRWKEGEAVSIATEDFSVGVVSILEDKDGNMWIGTAGAGLKRISKASNSTFVAENLEVASYTTSEGLFNDTIHEILEDNSGRLWMSCPKGIFHVSRREIEDYDSGKISHLTCLVYGKADGLLNTDCKGVAKPAGWKSRDGRLWFPTARGVVVVQPDIRLNELPPPVVIEEVKADKRGAENHGNGFATPHLSPVTIPPGRGELEFHYTALSFTAPEKNRFKYKLEGFDNDWIDAGARRTAYYNNLDPGSYRFRVMACNNDGVWNESGATLGVVLKPHLWQTWWFRVAAVAVVVLALAMLHRARVARLREIEQVRMKIAADLHDEVGSSLGSIVLMSEMLRDFGNVGETEKKRLGKINRVAMQTSRSIRDIVWFINPQYDTTQDLLVRMKDVASTMLGAVEYRFETPQENLLEKLPLEFRQNFFLMFKEILNNIIKHSQATCVEIHLSQSQDGWQLRVRDNGIGFDTCASSKGNGLKNLQRRAEKLKGRLEIQSQTGSGTMVLFSVKK